MKTPFSVKSKHKTVYAMCQNPRPRCPLFQLFAPLPNLRVLSGKTPEHNFLCSIVLRGTPAEINEYMPVAVNLTQQVCQQCQEKLSQATQKAKVR